MSDLELDLSRLLKSVHVACLENIVFMINSKIRVTLGHLLTEISEYPSIISHNYFVLLQKSIPETKALGLYQHIHHGVDGKCLSIRTLSLEKTKDTEDFMLGMSSTDDIIIKHTREGSLLRKGDKIVEVNGKCVLDLDLNELTYFLKHADVPISLVILRETSDFEKR